MPKAIIALVVLVGLAACAASDGRPADTVSVQYDMNNYDPDAMEAAALAQCRAKNYKEARLYTTQPAMQGGGWAYRIYGCY